MLVQTANLRQHVRSWMRHVWIGAGVTVLLFTTGKTLLGFYLGRASLTSAYGAAGSLLVFLLWSDYVAQIVFSAWSSHGARRSVTAGAILRRCRNRLKVPGSSDRFSLRDAPRCAPHYSLAPVRRRRAFSLGSAQPDSSR
jgi:hypothetical protein